MCIPTFLVQYFDKEVNFCTNTYPDEWMGIAYGWLWLLLLAFIPVSLMFALYSRVVYALWFKPTEAIDSNNLQQVCSEIPAPNRACTCQNGGREEPGWVWGGGGGAVANAIYVGNKSRLHAIIYSFKGAVCRFYHNFERFKNTPRSYITQQKWFYFGKHHSANDKNPLGSVDG